MSKSSKANSSESKVSDSLAPSAASLEKLMKHRASVDDLASQGIYKAGGKLAAQQASLQKEMIGDALTRSLEMRPNRGDVVQAGIAADSDIAPALQAAAKNLERNLIVDSVNRQLHARPDVEELKASGVMPVEDNVAPRLQSAKQMLEHAMMRDHIGQLLDTRPDVDQLVESNILPHANAQISSRIEGVAKQLAQRLTVDKVGHLLEQRANLEDLQHLNIVGDTNVANSLQGVQKKLERELAKSNLYHALNHRMPRSELEARNIIEEGDYDDDEYEAEERYESYRDELERDRNIRDSYSYEPAYQRRSKNFILTRILLKFVAHMSETGEISLQQKGYLKDLIVDQNSLVLAAAEVFELDGDVREFKDTLWRICAEK